MDKFNKTLVFNLDFGIKTHIIYLYLERERGRKGEIEKIERRVRRERKWGK